MKILILSWRDTKHPWRGGAEVYLHEIAKKLAASGHKITYFTSSHPGGSLPEENIDNIKIIRRGNRFTVYFWAFWYYITQFRNQFDLVLDQSNGVPFFSPAYITSTPVVCLFHHIFKKQWFKEIYFPLNYLGYFLERYLIPFAYKHNHFIAVSPSTRQDMIDYLGINPDQITIINNAVAPYFKKTVAKSVNPSIVYVGRLKKYKQINLLIRSLLRLLYRYPNLKLHLIGEGDDYNQLQDLSRRLGIEKSVIFHGYVSEKLKVDIISSAWILVNPSSHEGWGITIIEAAACGTTSVGSCIDGLKDSINDNQTGLLFENGSIYQLSQKINDILSQPGLRYKLEKQALENSRKFTWPKSAKKMEKLFARIINQDQKISSFKPMKSKTIVNLKKLPLVSIILPTKNVAGFVKNCLNSIKAQSYPNIELIIVDNYSTDGTYQLAKEYSDKVYSHGPERNHQRNYAVSKSGGKYLLFIDSDMTLDTNLVADCVYNLERFTRSVAAILPEIQVGKTIWSKARRLEKEFYLGDENMESPRFFNKEAYLKSGGYDSELLYAEDMDLAARIRKLGKISRSQFYVYHNEDRLSYFDIIQKKYFYGLSAKYYFRKNPQKSGKTTKFIRPAFIQNWRKFLDNPLISVAFFFLRTTELSAMAFGYLVSLTQNEKRQHSKI